MKEKMLHWGTAFILACAITRLALANPDDPEKIQLSDGTKLILLGVTHGTHHYAPGYENSRTFNWIYTPSNSTVVWIEAEHDQSRWPSYELLVSDRAKTACIITEKRSSSHVQAGVDIQGFVLKAFPRWEKETVLRAKPYNGPIAEGQFVITNDMEARSTDWTPESMPVTKSDGDFEVTLTNLIAGVPLPHHRGRTAPENDPMNQCVRLAFGFQQNGHSATNWSPRFAQTSDAAGNLVEGAIQSYPQGGIYVYPTVGHPGEFNPKTDGYYYRPSLWPGETAWKVRLEFTRTSGFNDDEIVTFTNLPVRTGTQQEADDEWTWDPNKTNFTFTPATVNGVQLKLLEPLLAPNRSQPGRTNLSVIIYVDPNPTKQGMLLTLLEATDDQGRPLWSPWKPGWAGHFDLQFPDPRPTKTLNLKLALHKSRFVEFTVKPAKQ